MTEQSAGAARCRAAKACRRCNQRRIKCDALEKGTPCSRCVQSNQQDACILLDSRRGTYPRKKTRGSSSNVDATSIRHTTGQIPPGEHRPTTDDDNASPCSSSQAITLRNTDRVSSATRSLDSPPSTAPNNKPSPHIARLSSTSTLRVPTATQDLTSPESTATNNTNGPASSYCEISWAAMFERFLINRKQDRTGTIDKCSITYLGESFPLSIVLADLEEGGRPRLHHAGPPLEETVEAEEQHDPHEHPSHMLPEDISYLEAKRVFELPPDEVLDALIHTYLDKYWPIYPIVLRHELIQQYRKKTVPIILLHSICFVAATYCSSALLHRSGHESRKQARFEFYKKAKALFDTGYEKNKITVLQSVIMLTFWGGGPNSYWNFYSWIGTGVTIAETLGLHRSLKGANMSLQDRSLLRRLWWTLVIRDASCGALVGRPFRINMNHCDTEMLTEADFEYDISSPEFATHPERTTFSLYQIHMTKLSLILRDIVVTRFEPGKRATAANLSQSLQVWRRELPPAINWTETTTNLNIFAACLCIQYHHHVILAHLGTQMLDLSNTYSATSIGGIANAPEAAAHRIAALSVAIVTRSQVLSMTHEAFQGLFLAMVVFYTQMKSTQPMLAQLGRTALSNCQLVLHDAREAWDPAPWILKLFDNLISNLEEERPTAEVAMPPDSLTGDFNPVSGAGVVHPFGQPGLVNIDFDHWQSHPTLGDFFMMPQNVDMFQTYGSETTA